jgi:hypothetical protein
MITYAREKIYLRLYYAVISANVNTNHRNAKSRALTVLLNLDFDKEIEYYINEKRRCTSLAVRYRYMWP